MGGVKEAWLEQMEKGYTPVGEKFVCGKCIVEYAINEFIEEVGEIHKCSYCTNKVGKVKSVPIDSLIEFILEGIGSEWGDPNDEGVAWDGGWEGAEVYDSWDLLSDELEIDFDSRKLFEDVANAIMDRQWCKIDPYGPDPGDEWLFDWQHFCKQVKHHTRYVFFKLPKKKKDSSWNQAADNPYDILYHIGSIVNRLGLVAEVPVGTEFFRVRVHPEGSVCKTVKEIGPPPLEYATAANRMSPAGIPMFYGAFDNETALAEAAGEVGKLATIAKFTTMKKFKVLDLTKLPYVPSIFDREGRNNRSAIYFMRDFLKDLSKPITKNGTEHIEYVPTQIVTEYFRHIFKDSGNGKIKGIIYPSSVSNDGKSCVLFFTSENCIDNKSDKDKNSWLSMSTKSIKVQKIT
jgi:hypothetical protein